MNAHAQFGKMLPAVEAAELLGLARTKLGQLQRNNELLLISEEGRTYVPADLLEPNRAETPAEDSQYPGKMRPVLNLRGTITVLRDAGFQTEEIADWLWSVNEELGETPLQALRAGKHHHVNRIASVQSL